MRSGEFFLRQREGRELMGLQVEQVNEKHGCEERVIVNGMEYSNLK